MLALFTFGCATLNLFDSSPTNGENSNMWTVGNHSFLGQILRVKEF